MKRAFTLIEMIVATMLVAMLLGAVSLSIGALARDERVMAQRGGMHADDHLLDLFSWDLRNAKTVAKSPDGVVIVGHGGIDLRSMTASARPARVTYRIVRSTGAGKVLIREQRYLDDPVQSQPWSEVVAVGAQRLEVLDASDVDGAPASALPEQLLVRVAFENRVVARVLARH